MSEVLNVKDLNITYKNKEKSVYAVKNASFTLQQGDSLGIVGESGSGKTTLAMGILRLLPKQSALCTGEAIFDGQDDLLKISEARMNQLRWDQISVVFQKAMNALSPVHRIRDMCEDIYKIHYPHASNMEIRENMMELLSLVNLPERVYDLYPHEMSGGMLQRVAIAMSLMHKPRLLIFDEATTALDVVTQGQILEEIVEMEKVLNTTRIMITHDMSVVASSCSRIAVMYAGEIVELGDVNKVMLEPKHPYTAALIKAFPSLKGEQHKIESIPGFLPDLSQEIEGCVFAPRCKYAFDRCHREKPYLQSLAGSPGQEVACFLHTNNQTGHLEELRED